eukprot:Lankesteria_metandrocarpae@DN4928_c0_g1_i5.p1
MESGSFDFYNWAQYLTRLLANSALVGERRPTTDLFSPVGLVSLLWVLAFSLLLTLVVSKTSSAEGEHRLLSDDSITLEEGRSEFNACELSVPLVEHSAPLWRENVNTNIPVGDFAARIACSDVTGELEDIKREAWGAIIRLMKLRNGIERAKKLCVGSETSSQLEAAEEFGTPIDYSLSLLARTKSVDIIATPQGSIAKCLSRFGGSRIVKKLQKHDLNNVHTRSRLLNQRPQSRVLLSPAPGDNINRSSTLDTDYRGCNVSSAGPRYCGTSSILSGFYGQRPDSLSTFNSDFWQTNSKHLLLSDAYTQRTANTHGSSNSRMPYLPRLDLTPKSLEVERSQPSHSSLPSPSVTNFSDFRSLFNSTVQGVDSDAYLNSLKTFATATGTPSDLHSQVSGSHLIHSAATFLTATEFPASAISVGSHNPFISTQRLARLNTEPPVVDRQLSRSRSSRIHIGHSSGYVREFNQYKLSRDSDTFYPNIGFTPETERVRSAMTSSCYDGGELQTDEVPGLNRSQSSPVESCAQ